MRGWLGAAFVLTILASPALADPLPGPGQELGPGCSEGEACDNEGPLCQGPDFYVFCDPILTYPYCEDGHWHLVCAEQVPNVEPSEPPAPPSAPDTGDSAAALARAAQDAQESLPSAPEPEDPIPSLPEAPGVEEQERPADDVDPQVPQPEAPKDVADRAEDRAPGAPAGETDTLACDTPIRYGPGLPMPLIDAPTTLASVPPSDGCAVDAPAASSTWTPDVPVTASSDAPTVPRAGATMAHAAVGLATAAVALAAWWAWSVRAAATIALYTRLGAGRVLRHPDRARIVAAVAADPGIELTALVRGLGMRPSTAAYHVHVLAHFGHLRVERHGGRSSLLPPTRTLRGEGQRLGLLRRPAVARVHALLCANPGIDQATLAARLGVRQQSVSKTLARLTAVGLVHRRDDARPTRYEAVMVPSAHPSDERQPL